MGCNDVTIPLVKLSQILIFINLLVILVILILSADIYWVSDIKKRTFYKVRFISKNPSTYRVRLMGEYRSR